MSMNEPSMKTVSFDWEVCRFMISIAQSNEIVVWKGVSFSHLSLSLSLKTLPLEQKNIMTSLFKPLLIWNHFGGDSQHKENSTFRGSRLGADYGWRVR